jgi:hypothetical protein
MKLYVQADTGNMPHHFDAACVLYGALDSGVETRLIRMEDLAGINNLTFVCLYKDSVMYYFSQRTIVHIKLV